LEQLLRAIQIALRVSECSQIIQVGGQGKIRGTTAAFHQGNGFGGSPRRFLLLPAPGVVGGLANGLHQVMTVRVQERRKQQDGKAEADESAHSETEIIDRRTSSASSPKPS